MTSYICRKCNYRFSPKKKDAPAKCPFCDTSGTLIKEKGASDLLAEDLSYFDRAEKQ